MRIILSPAKKMNEDLDCPLAPSSLPEYLEQTEEILAWLKGKPHEELKALWACNDKIAEQNSGVPRIPVLLGTLMTRSVLSFRRSLCGCLFRISRSGACHFLCRW